eukprot:1529485-Rhodomonas_salina.4
MRACGHVLQKVLSVFSKVETRQVLTHCVDEQGVLRRNQFPPDSWGQAGPDVCEDGVSVEEVGGFPDERTHMHACAAASETPFDTPCTLSHQQPAATVADVAGMMIGLKKIAALRKEQAGVDGMSLATEEERLQSSYNAVDALHQEVACPNPWNNQLNMRRRAH